uniref:Uncharacterized protein n=1 Tax=Geobacter metallireducens TaxID=28232 RepID=A0A831UC73_GEOME
MKTTTFLHKVLASALVVVLLLISTAGFGLALALSQKKEQTPATHAGCGCITADDGSDESGCPASEASHGDFNPSCTSAPLVPAYAPQVETLSIYEPFRAPPQVYLDLFIPPKSHC